MRFVVAVSLVWLGVGASGCAERGLDSLPSDAHLVFFSGALDPVTGGRVAPGEAECEDLFCFGASIRVHSQACLGLSEGASVTLDGETFSTTARELNESFPEPGAVTGFIELGGWVNEGPAWVCRAPGVELYRGRDAPPQDEHEVRIQSDGAELGIRVTDDGELLACDFPRCTVTGDYSLAFPDVAR